MNPFSKSLLVFILTLFLSPAPSYSSNNPVRNIFMQGNNISTIFNTDGVFNCDKVSFSTWYSGFIWPVSSPQRNTLAFASGIWVGAKVGPQHELRVSGCWNKSHFTPGNIPVSGQVPPSSVCSDSTWRGYLVNLNDPTLVNGGVRTKTAGGITRSFNYDSWANWPISKGAAYVEVNGVPGYQPGWNSDRPGIGNSSSRPDEICFMVYMDFTNCTNNIHDSDYGMPGGSLPLGMEIQQTVFLFNCYENNNAYYSKWKIINKSNLTWDSVYISLPNDFDIGDPTDDAASCDTSRNMAYLYNYDNYDVMYGSAPPGLAASLVQGPLKYTGNTQDTAFLPYDTLTGYKVLGMTALFAFPNINNPCITQAYNYTSAYFNMNGLDCCGNPIINPVTGLPTKFCYPGNVCFGSGWRDNSSDNKFFVLSSGPFILNPADTQLIVACFDAERGSSNIETACKLLTKSELLRRSYFRDFDSCSVIGIQPISSEVPQHFALYQNYPNPFNPATKIRFSIPVVGDAYMRPVRIVIYDALGREIAVLVNESLAPGTYETDFDASNLPSGVYFYKLSSGEFTESKKMILIK